LVLLEAYARKKALGVLREDDPSREDIWARMEQAGVQPTIKLLNASLMSVARDGEVDLLEEALKQHGLEPSPITVTIVVQAYVSAKSPDKAELAFREMVAGGAKPSVFSYTALVEGMVEAERFHDALRLVHEMRELQLRPNDVTLHVLLREFKTAGFPHVAMLDLIDSLIGDGLSPSQAVLTVAMASCIEADDAPRALRLFNWSASMRAPSEGLLNMAAVAHATLSNVQAAVAAIDSLQEQELRISPLAASAVCQSLHHVAGVLRAASFSLRMLDADIACRSNNEIALGLLTGGHFTELESLLDKAAR
jgi:pentatricopeptide repeat protein